MKGSALVMLVAGLTFSLAANAFAGDSTTSGKLLLTDGVGTVEGAAGGGLAAWAVIAGGETVDGLGLRAHATYVSTPAFSLTTEGVSVGLFDRVELSYARQAFDTGRAGAALGLGRGFTFDQDVVGAKVRLAGDAVYDQDRWLPQISAGAQYKSNDEPAVVRAVGARRDSGVDYYLAATKLFLAQSLLLNATVRATRANQFGILGFGGDRRGGYSAQGEGSAAYLLTRRLVVGAEYRSKPDNLRFAREDPAFDVFAAYAFNKSLSLTVAYVDLGSIATFTGQRGAYVSLQAGFLTPAELTMGPLLAVLLLLQPGPADAPPPPGEQPVTSYAHSDANAGAKPVVDPAVFKAFHGLEGLQRICGDALARDMKDPRIKDVFAAADVVRLKRTLAEQICYLLDGGCTYSGRDMTAAHKGMGLQNADFNAVVENLQLAMDDEHVPFRAQNVLLAKLAPMQRTIVERKSPAMLKEAGRRFGSLLPAR